jgi:copper transport protein
LLLALVVVAFPLALAAPAGAHAVLESTSPGAGQVVPAGQAVSVVEMRFGEAVEVSLGSVRVLAANGRRVDLAHVYHPDGIGARVAVALRSGLAQGSYLVVWRVVSADSHPVAGSFTFSLGHAGPVASGSSGSSGRAVALALGVDRFVAYAGLVMLVGGVLFLLVCWPAGWAQLRARRLVWCGLGAAAVAALCGLGLQAAADVGASLSQVTDPAPIRDLLGTRLGQAHLARLAALAAMAVTLRLTPRRQRRWIGRPELAWSTLLGAESVVAVGTVAVEGHAATGAWPTARLPLDLLHVAAAAGWLGGLVMLVGAAFPLARRAAAADRPAAAPAKVAVGISASGTTVMDQVAIPGADEGERPRPVLAVDEEGPAVQRAVVRFSRLATGCVLVLAVTGLAAAWRQAGELDAITGTRYGQLVLVKAGLLAATLCVAAVSRRQVRIRTDRSLTASRPGTADRWAVLRRSVRAESALAVVVLAVTSVLVATTPARAAYRPTQLRTVAAGPLTVQVTAVPTAGRSLDLHLYAFGADGLIADVSEIRGEATMPAQRLGPVTVPLVRAGTGHFIAQRVLLPYAGEWTLQLTLHTGEFDSYSASTRLMVR